MFVIIVGGGKLGANLTRILLEEGNEIAVVDADWNRYRELKEWFPESAVFGNATELRVLREAGIERADSLVAVAGADQVNLVCSELAQRKYKLRNVVARV
ncbi:MAG: NAD-binding protein, partial [Actinomycetota bacterium]